MKIKDLKGGQNRVDVEGVIVYMMEPIKLNLRAGGTSDYRDALLEDESGSIKLQLWGPQINQVSQGDRIQISNGYTKISHGQLELCVGRYGKIAVLSDSKPAILMADPTEAEDRNCPICHHELSKDVSVKSGTFYWCWLCQEDDKATQEGWAQ